MAGLYREEKASKMFRSYVQIAILSLSMIGCAGPRMRTPVQPILMGEYGQARAAVLREMEEKRGDRAALLDAVRLGVLTLDDGLPEAAMFTLSDAYDTLRTQGINRDRTVAAVVLNEDVKIYKGEPFEQALALSYYAMAHASQGSWDNARAASLASLFYLQDFEGPSGGADEGGWSADATRAADDAAARSARFESLVNQGMDPREAARRVDADADVVEGEVDRGYVAVESDFTLGYLLAGVANQQMGREDEASDYFLRVRRLDPRLDELVQTLRQGQYNTLLVVSFGLGPRKAPANEDATATVFLPRFPSGDDLLSVRVEGFDARRYPVVLDVNAMSRDARWRGWEGFRRTKSALGSGLVWGGLAAALLSNDDDVKLAGLGAAAAGLFVKAGSHADMRFIDVYPQRFYVVPLNLAAPTTLTLQIDRHPVSRLVLHDLAPPDVLPGQPTAQLRYVRLVTGYSPGMAPPPWAVADRTRYANPYAASDPAPRLPYILGGRDVRPPTESTLDDYQAHGYLTTFTLNGLTNLYRDENIFWDVQETNGLAPPHVLEGGPSLLAPLPGTTGYARLFSGRHPPYAPRTDRVAQLQRRLTPGPDADASQVVSRPLTMTDE